MGLVLALGFSCRASPSLTSLDLVARMLPFFSNSDRSGDGGGVAFWQRDFFWQLESFPLTDDSGIINLVDPTAWKVTEPVKNSDVFPMN